MKIESIYNPIVLAAEAWEPLTSIAERMRFNDVGAFAVLDHDRFVGIVTERDITMAVAEGLDLALATAGDSMTAEPAAVGTDTEVGEAAEIMLGMGVRHLPVVVDGRIVGMVSIRDVLGARSPA